MGSKVLIGIFALLICVSGNHNYNRYSGCPFKNAWICTECHHSINFEPYSNARKDWCGYECGDNCPDSDSGKKWWVRQIK